MKDGDAVWEKIVAAYYGSILRPRERRIVTVDLSEMFS